MKNLIQMKTIFTMVFCILTSAIFAQSTGKFNISASTERTADFVEVTIFMDKAEGDEIELGNSNFRLKATNANGEKLPIYDSKKNIAVFTAFDKNQNYKSSSIRINEKRNLVSLNILRNNGANGELITEEKVAMGSVLIPVNSIDSDVNLEWEVANGDVTTYDLKLVHRSTLNYEPIPTVKGLDLVSQENGLQISGIFPNPVVNDASIVAKVDGNSDAVLRIFNIKGQLVSESVQKLYTGVNTLNIDASAFDKGNYLVELETAEGKASEKLLKK
jgi:hypothetical protein